MNSPAEVAANVARTTQRLVTDSGVSESALADATGIPRPTLRRRLRTTSNWYVEDVAAIATALGTTYARIALEAERVA
jgi:DNA-binding phage protein